MSEHGNDLGSLNVGLMLFYHFAPLLRGEVEFAFFYFLLSELFEPAEKEFDWSILRRVLRNENDCYS